MFDTFDIGLQFHKVVICVRDVRLNRIQISISSNLKRCRRTLWHVSTLQKRPQNTPYENFFSHCREPLVTSGSRLARKKKSVASLVGPHVVPSPSSSASSARGGDQPHLSATKFAKASSPCADTKLASS